MKTKPFSYSEIATGPRMGGCVIDFSQAKARPIAQPTMHLFELPSGDIRIIRNGVNTVTSLVVSRRELDELQAAIELLRQREP